MKNAARRPRPYAKAASAAKASSSWPQEVYDVLKRANVRQASYVPDAGHTQLINLLLADAEIHTTVLTTEEEGIAMAAGAWLGGHRSVVLMQSSGVGNIINMLSLIAACRFPLLVLVTMRGEWAEFNPWQVPMGSATPAALELMGLKIMRVDREQDCAEIVASAATLAFESDQAIAVLLSQRMLGAKKWVEK